MKEPHARPPQLDVRRLAGFERAMIVDRVKSGLAKAKASGVEMGRGKRKDGSRTADEERWRMLMRAGLEKRILRLHKRGTGISRLGKNLVSEPALYSGWRCRGLSGQTHEEQMTEEFVDLLLVATVVIAPVAFLLWVRAQ